jgi:elongation factor P hydroxylase
LGDLVIILDCCFSGAFDPSLIAKNDESVDLPKSEWKAPSFSYGDEHGSGFSHLEEVNLFCAILKR